MRDRFTILFSIDYGPSKELTFGSYSEAHKAFNDILEGLPDRELYYVEPNGRMHLLQDADRILALNYTEYADNAAELCELMG